MLTELLRKKLVCLHACAAACVRVQQEKTTCSFLIESFAAAAGAGAAALPSSAVEFAVEAFSEICGGPVKSETLVAFAPSTPKSSLQYETVLTPKHTA